MLLISNRSKCVGLLGAIGLLASAAFAVGPQLSGGKAVKQLPVAEAQKKLNKASTRFIENVGQWPNKAHFLARSENMNFWLTNEGLTFDYFRAKTSSRNTSRKGHVIGMTFDGATAFNPQGEGKLRFVTDYLNAKLKRQHTASSFSGATAKGVYPGIDVRAYMDPAQQKPRYDLVVAPNANPNQIKIAFHGATSTAVVNNAIAIKTQIGTLSEGHLFAYQFVAGSKRPVSASFVALGHDKYGFKLGSYDHSKQLVIDPLVYGSYYGGDGGMDDVKSVTTDNAGGVYMTGWTMAPDFPSIYGPYGFQIHGGRDAFVSKLQGDAYSHDYAAIIAGSLDDYGQFIKIDPHGDVWIAGRTQSSDFPGNEVYQRPNVQFIQMTQTVQGGWYGGSYVLDYGNGTYDTAPIQWNASTSDVAAALNNALGTAGVQVTSTGGTLDQGATYRIALPWNYPLLLQVIHNRLGPDYILQKNPLPNLPLGQVVQISTGLKIPRGGTYSLTFVNGAAGATPLTTGDIAYNATAAAVQTAVDTAIGAGNAKVTSEGGATPPYLITFQGAWGLNPASVSIDSSQLVFGVYTISTVDQYTLTWDQTTPTPAGGFIGYNLLGNTVFGFYNDPANFVQLRLALVVGGSNVTVTSSGGSLPNATYLIQFIGSSAGAVDMTLNDEYLQNRPTYTVLAKTSDVFVMRFQQSATTVLDPVTTEAVSFFGGDSDELLAGFSIMPKANPAPTDPVTFAFGGTVAPADYQQLVPVTDIPAAFPGGQAGYIAKYTYDEVANSFTLDSNVPRYVSGGNSVDLNGVVMDPQGSVYTGGTVHFSGNVDTSVNPVFTTTPGVFQGGRLLRNDDLFVQKYRPDGSIAYSALIGGNDSDNAGGLDFDLDGTTVNAGSCIDVDQNLDLYIVGISRSFNFPRTRGVFGETFNASANVTVTKINSDASSILYSTNLKTSGLVLPAGVAVDLKGDAFVTGNVHPDFYDFPDTFTFSPLNAANPNEPNSMPLGTIQTTTQGVNGAVETALVGTNAQPTGGAGDIATTTGFLNLLNSSATTLLYGTYLGGALDDRVYGPFVDSFGDVWVYGWTDNYRSYTLTDSSGNPHTFSDNGGLPAAMISPLAFKATPDANGYTNLNGILYGALSETYPQYTPWSWTPTTTAPGFPIPTIQVTYKRDGWLDKIRVNLASVASVTFNPNTVPGGLGATTTGTVTLSQGAPSGGASIVLTLNSTSAASFSSDPTQAQGTLVLNIATGQTTGTFTVYTSGVPMDTAVQVKATYQGSFSIGQFTVTPWLQQLSLTPTSVVGGNSVTGRITLATLPPTGSGGVAVTVLTDSPSIVNFQGKQTTQVTVPEGQASVTFEIDTSGVGTISFPQITASLLGVGKTQTLTVTLASLKSITFDNGTVAGGTDVTGTVTLDGQATGPFYVNLSSGDPTFTFDTGNSNPAQLIFNQGETQKSFTIHTPYKPTSTQTVITAERPAQGNYPDQTISNTLFIKAAEMTNFTISPSEVPGGSTSQGTVIIGNAAPAGGVVINLTSSDPSTAQVPATVTVPSGATSAVFTITTTVVPTTTVPPVTITATRGPVVLTQQLTVDGVQFALTISPNTVIGGSQGTATGTITLPAPSPAGGLTFNLNSDQACATFGQGVTSVTIPEGATTATFSIFTTPPSAVSQTVNISAYLGVLGGPGSQTQQMTVRQVGVATIKFSPAVISGRAPRNKTICTITLDGPAAADGTITLSSTVAKILNLPASVAIKQGQTGVSFSVTSNVVSRTLATVVTATFGAGSGSAVVTVTR